MGKISKREIIPTAGESAIPGQEGRGGGAKKRKQQRRRNNKKKQIDSGWVE